MNISTDMEGRKVKAIQSEVTAGPSPPSQSGAPDWPRAPQTKPSDCGT